MASPNIRESKREINDYSKNQFQSPLFAPDWMDKAARIVEWIYFPITLNETSHRIESTLTHIDAIIQLNIELSAGERKAIAAAPVITCESRSNVRGTNNTNHSNNGELF